MATIWVDLNGKDYKLSNEGFYPLILFKRLKGKNFTGNTEDIEELLTLIWCYFKSSNKDFDIELEDFFQKADLNMINKFNELNSTISSEKKTQEIL